MSTSLTHHRAAFFGASCDLLAYPLVFANTVGADKHKQHTHISSVLMRVSQTCWRKVIVCSLTYANLRPQIRHATRPKVAVAPDVGGADANAMSDDMPEAMPDVVFTPVRDMSCIHPPPLAELVVVFLRRRITFADGANLGVFESVMTKLNSLHCWYKSLINYCA